MRCRIMGSRSPSFAVRRIVSAMAWICAELTGTGSDATAVSSAAFMMSIVSGANDAFEKSNIPAPIRRSPRASPSPASHLRLMRLREHGSPAPAPAPAPAASPAAATAEQTDHEEQQDRADGGVDDRADHAGAEMHAELRQQPAADKRAQDSDDDIADDPEAGAADDLARQPARDETNKQDDQKALARHVHFVTSIVWLELRLICAIWSISVTSCCGNGSSSL